MSITPPPRTVEQGRRQQQFWAFLLYIAHVPEKTLSLSRTAKTAADGATKRHDAALDVAKANDTDPQANGLLGGESWPVGWVSELNLGANRNLLRVILSPFAT